MIKELSGRVEECPDCESKLIRPRWAMKNRVEDKCLECGWIGDPYLPPKQEIQTTKTIPVDRFGGYIFELYDGLGYIREHSKSYRELGECEAEAEKQLATWNLLNPDSPATVIIWPLSVTVNALTVLK